MQKGTALITGGSKRIGKGIATKLARLGYTIVLHYNSSDVEAAQTLQEIKQIQPKSIAIKIDLADLQSTETLIKKIFQSFPDLSLLVNSASIFEKQSIKDTTTEMLLKQTTINYMTPFILAREFAHYVQGGNIINILDAKVKHSESGLSSYLISKKALFAFNEIAALEFAPTIRVNAIAPGAILPPPGKSEEYFSTLKDRIPLKRNGTTGDIEEALNFLLENTYITGQVIYVDGGMYL